MLYLSIGFTGTQIGLSPEQTICLDRLLTKYYNKYWEVSNGLEFHHGDCIGGDEQFHANVIQLIGIDHQERINVHPPEDNKKRAYCQGTIWPEKDYIPRNHDIVDNSGVMFACPKEHKQQLRSGTWATYRYARHCDRLVWLILPDGHLFCYTTANQFIELGIELEVPGVAFETGEAH